jgi:hypothetical protein
VAGVIRLPEGRGSKDGYGRLHIHENASRMAQIKGLGFATAAQFVAAIATNWIEVIAANEPNRLVLCCPKDGYGLRLVVQHYRRGDLQFWSTVTALPGRKNRPKDVLFKR